MQAMESGWCAPRIKKEARCASHHEFIPLAGACRKARGEKYNRGLSIRQATRGAQAMFDCDDAWIPVSLENCDSVAGPFYHGTKADLSIGDLLTAGFRSNYRDDVVMNHVYFTTLPKGAGLAAEIAKGEGRPRVYVVVPTGRFEDDPNVTNKKFRGNPTRSYRSEQPLEIVGELERWESHDPEFVLRLRTLAASASGEIIN